MTQIDNNQATEFVHNDYFSFDFEETELPRIEVMAELNTASTFCEYVHRHAVRCGYQGESADIKSLAAFIAEKCNKADLTLGSGAKATLERWLSKGLPGNTADGRDNVYKLCFALEMDARQTAEFFLKAYLERPFNYKSISEAVYFYCLKNRLSYKDAIRIISTVEETAAIQNPYADDVTEQIGEQLRTIETEAELITYLTENRSGFAVENKTATDKIQALIKSCSAVAPKEYDLYYPYTKEIVVNNIDELLSVIYGYSARATENAKPLYKKSITKSDFPQLVKRNWPQREQFQQILEKKNASYDVVRRALIMLLFYDFFATATIAEKEAEAKRRKTGKEEPVAHVSWGLFDEFETEANTVLAECGYVRLYWRNPFDWMIGYCAMAPEPLRMLRTLILEYYLNDPSVMDE
ncbi:MAG: hypothetical protein IKU07_01750 [Oscillospiraceae bacterium]|nr:hypothetical protein [Oscillospiraceae bacterium]